MSSASKFVTVATMAIVLTVGVLVSRTVTDEQLQAMEQCEPQCQLGAPLFHVPGPAEFAATALLVIGVALLVSSVTAGWPISSAQFR